MPRELGRGDIARDAARLRVLLAAAPGGRYFGFDETQIITGSTPLTGTDTVGTAIDLASVLPSGASTVQILLHVWGSTGGNVSFGPGNTSFAVRKHVWQYVQSASPSVGVTVCGPVAIQTPQTIYRTHDAVGGTVYYGLYVLGYCI